MNTYQKRFTNPKTYVLEQAVSYGIMCFISSLLIPDLVTLENAPWIIGGLFVYLLIFEVIFIVINLLKKLFTPKGK